MTILLRQKPLPQVVRQIVQRDNGAWLDPSDLSTLYQDAAGTIPVTAVEQPVGLMLDKSRGLMLGPELVSNGTFDTDTIWTKQTGWSISTGSARCDGSQVSTSLLYQAVLELGKCYRIEFDVVITAGTMSVRTGATGADSTVTTSGRKIQTGFCGGNTNLQIRASVGFVGSIDNISVRELYGYHATQPITASRPTLSARYNLLTKTEDFSSGVWAKSGTTASARTINFSATNTSRAVYAYLGSGDFTITAIFSPLDVGKKIRLSFWASGLDGITVGGGVSPDLTIPDTGVVSYTRTGLTSVTNIGIVNSSDGLAKSVTLRDGFGVSLVLGTTSGPYQRVNTSTDYDTDERYFSAYLRFDGVDDYLNLPYMGLYAGGSASVVAGVCGHQFGKTYNGRVICESLVSSSLPTYAPCVDKYNIKTMNIYMTNNTGTPFAVIDMSLPQNSTNIISVIDSGNSVKSYQNAGQKVASSYLRSGSVTLDSTTIGKGLNNGSTEIWMGDLYSLIITKSALSDAQRIKCERYTASKAGVTL